MPMPKATMDKNRDARTDENNVGSTGQITAM
jgi:hypothetical protein